MLGVLYFSDVLEFSGPDVIAGIAAITTTTATPLNHAQPWNINTTRAGQIFFFNAMAVEIEFKGRRPYLLAFETPDRSPRHFTLTVANAGGGLAVVTATLPIGVIGEPYLFVLQGEGGTPAYAWTSDLTSALPAGVVLNVDRLEGTPTAAGNFQLDVTLTDATTANVARSLPFTIAAANAAVRFETAANLPAAVAGQPYSLMLAANGGTGRRAVEHLKKVVTDALPAGMTLDADGKIEWLLPVAGNYTFDAEVVDWTTRRATITLVVANAGLALAVGTAGLPAGIINEPYCFQLQPDGGTGPYVWADTIASVLPGGVALNGNKLEGTPTAAGPFHLDVTLTDSTLTTVNATLNFTIAAVGAKLAFGTAPALPAAIEDQPYATILTTTGGVGAKSLSHFKTLAHPTLPAGMTLGADGTIIWPLPVAGNYTFEVEVVDTSRSFKLLGGHAPPDARYPDNVTMVENMASILEITTLRAGISVAICGDFNVCTLDVDGCLNKHWQDELDAFDNLILAGYGTRNANRRSSLKSAANAQKTAYVDAKDNGVVALDTITTNAFDHVLTQGFAGVASVDTMNLVALDPGYANAVVQAQASKPAPIKAIVKKYLWSSGVSDHLPVKFTLTL
jgi:sugar lactone lactonase YvrE